MLCQRRLRSVSAYAVVPAARRPAPGRSVGPHRHAAPGPAARDVGGGPGDDRAGGGVADLEVGRRRSTVTSRRGKPVDATGLGGVALRPAARSDQRTSPVARSTPYQCRLPNCGLFSRSSTSPSGAETPSSRAGRRHSARSVPAVSATVGLGADRCPPGTRPGSCRPTDVTSRRSPRCTATAVRDSSSPPGSAYVLTILFCTAEPAGPRPALTTKSRSLLDEHGVARAGPGRSPAAPAAGLALAPASRRDQHATASAASAGAGAVRRGPGGHRVVRQPARASSPRSIRTSPTPHCAPGGGRYAPVRSGVGRRLDVARPGRPSAGVGGHCVDLRQQPERLDRRGAGPQHPEDGGAGPRLVAG